MICAGKLLVSGNSLLMFLARSSSMMRLLAPAMLLGISLIAKDPPLSGFRTWDTGYGANREFALLKNEMGLLHLKGKDGRLTKISANSLSTADQGYLRSIGQSWPKTPCTVPEMVLVKAGSFRPGDDIEGLGSFAGRKRAVSVIHDFWIGRFEVTQSEWQAVMPNNPSVFKRRNLPVETVNWYQAMEFCDALTKSERTAGRLPKGLVYRLPTNVEWEYAAHGGKMASTGMGPTLNSRQANFFGKYPYRIKEAKGNHHDAGQPMPVGSFPGNNWGLHDMHGNVWEWCLDTASAFAWSTPKGFTEARYDGFEKTIRGGSWQAYGQLCRTSFFLIVDPFTVSSGDLGFRIALGPEISTQPNDRSTRRRYTNRQIDRLVERWKEDSEKEMNLFWRKNRL